MVKYKKSYQHVDPSVYILVAFGALKEIFSPCKKSYQHDGSIVLLAFLVFNHLWFNIQNLYWWVHVLLAFLAFNHRFSPSKLYTDGSTCRQLFLYLTISFQHPKSILMDPRVGTFLVFNHLFSTSKINTDGSTCWQLFLYLTISFHHPQCILMDPSVGSFSCI